MKKLFLLLAFCSPIYSMRSLKTSHRPLYSSIIRRNLSHHPDKLRMDLSGLLNQLQDTAQLLQLLKESHETKNDNALQAIMKSLPNYVEGCINSTLQLKNGLNKD